MDRNQVTPPPLEVVSTLLLAATFGLAASSLLNLFPYEDFARLGSSRLSGAEWASLVLAGGASFWVVLLGMAARFFRFRREAARSTGAPLDLTSLGNAEPAIDRLLALTQQNNIVFRLYGDPAAVTDDGAPLVLSPYAVHAPRPGGDTETSVILPAAFWVRLRPRPRALGAVLAHEIAHLTNRDIELVFGARRLLVCVMPIALLATILSMVRSVFADWKAVGPDWQAIAASLVGKNYLVSNILLVLAMVAVVNRLEIWREALADDFAARLFGDKALEDAERLVAGSEGTTRAALGRPSVWQRRQAVAASPRLWALYGFIVAAAADYSSGPFAYLANVVASNPATRDRFVLGASVLSALIWFVGFYLPIRALLRNPVWGGGISPALPLLVAGAAVAQFLLQTLPLLVTSVAMPSGYDFIMRYDPVPLVVANLAGSATTASNYVVFASICAWITRDGSTAWLGIAPGFMWAIVAPLEVAYFPALGEGDVAILAAVIATLTVALLARPTLRRPDWSVVAVFSAVVLVAFLGWVGYGDVSHRAAASSHAGRWRWAAGDRDGALSSYRRAADRAPLVAQGWIDLALRLDQAGDLADALAASERGIHAPYLGAWAEKLAALSVGAALRLETKRPSDLKMAESYLETAESMWRRNSRLPRCDVAVLLYNAASADARLDRSAWVVLLHLFEAVTLDPALVGMALSDGDLAPVLREERGAPNTASIDVIARLPEKTPTAFRAAVLDGALPGEDLARLLAARLRRMAEQGQGAPQRNCGSDKRDQNMSPN